jgi:hypothetical protein
LTIVIWVEGDRDYAVLDEMLCQPHVLERRAHVKWAVWRTLIERVVGGDVHLDMRIGGKRETFLENIGDYVGGAFGDGADYVFALVDLHRSDPGPESVKSSLREAVHKIVKAPPTRERFHPHVAVPELEAWLLADAGAFPKKKRTRVGVPSAPEALRPGRAKQELDRLLKQLRGRQRGYKQTADARDIASRANPGVVMGKCPHFKELVEDLARCAGIGKAK